MTDIEIELANAKENAAAWKRRCEYLESGLVSVCQLLIEKKKEVEGLRAELATAPQSK
jgi:hypothetical protein